MFNIRECTKAEALDILQDQSVSSKLAFYPEDIKDIDMYLIDEKALLVTIPDGSGVEVHIASKYRDRVNLRHGLEGGIDWLRAKGFKYITTTAPNERKSLINMLKSLGFRQDSERWIYEWE